MSVMNGFDTESGERVFVYGADNSGFFEDAQATLAWKRYEEEFGPTPENQNRLGEILTQLHGHGEYISLSQFIDALNTGMDGGEFTRRAVEEAELEAPVEKPKKHQGHENWREHARWTETATADQIRERAKTDRSYAHFRRSSMIREMSGTPVGDAVQPAGVATKGIEVTPEIAAFAKVYRDTPSRQLKPVNGFVEAGGQRYSWSDFQSLVVKAASAGLI
jgi:hypothetical protein